MKKKWLGILLTLTLAAGVLPVSAYAAEEEQNGTDLGGGEMDFREAEENKSGEGWEWDAEDNILTLDDFNGYVPAGKLEKGAAIYLPKNSIVWIEGEENNLNVDSYHCSAIKGEGEILFRGDSVLNLDVESMSASAVFTTKGPLTFADEITVNIKSNGKILYVEDAGKKESIINVLDKAKVVLPMEKTADILITHRNSVKPQPIWCNYDEVIDKTEETATLSVRTWTPEPEKKPEPEQNPEEKPEPKVHAYTITIGSPVILKDGAEAYKGDVPAYIKSGYTMLPLRALMTVSNPDVSIQWDAASKTAFITNGDKHYSVTAGEAEMLKSGEKVTLSTAAEVKDGRLFLSLRDWMKVLEIPSEQVGWNNETKVVTLNY